MVGVSICTGVKKVFLSHITYQLVGRSIYVLKRMKRSNQHPSATSWPATQFDSRLSSLNHDGSETPSHFDLSTFVAYNGESDDEFIYLPPQSVLCVLALLLLFTWLLDISTLLYYLYVFSLTDLSEPCSTDERHGVRWSFFSALLWRRL